MSVNEPVLKPEQQAIIDARPIWWPIAINMIGKENAEQFLWVVTETGRTVEGNAVDGIGSGTGKIKLDVVKQIAFTWLRQQTWWSKYWLHELIWGYFVVNLIEWAVKQLKANKWVNPFKEVKKVVDTAVVIAENVEVDETA